MKKGLLVLSVIATLLTSTLAPTTGFASELNESSAAVSCYNSYDISYEFTRKVTGEPRALCEGTLTISGDLTASQIGTGNSDDNEISLRVYKERTGRDKEIASFTINLYGSDTTYFSETVGEIEEGNYYVVFESNSNSGWTFSGSGEMYVK